MTAFDTLLADIGPSPRRYPIEKGAHGVTLYGPWRIYYDPPPIPTRGYDWQWWHDDYDGAEDSNDTRCGACASFADALNWCDEWEDDNNGEQCPRCGGCGELDAGGAPCLVCWGSGK